MAKNNNFKKEVIRRRKPEPITMRKHFSTFEEAIDALRGTDEAINAIFAEVDENGNPVETDPINDPKEAIDIILRDFNEYVPDLIGNENIYTSLNVSSNRLTYRMDKGTAFGWLISYSVKEGHAVIEDVSVQIVIYDVDKLKDFVLDLTNSEWEQVTSHK